MFEVGELGRRLLYLDAPLRAWGPLHAFSVRFGMFPHCDDELKTRLAWGNKVAVVPAFHAGISEPDPTCTT